MDEHQLTDPQPNASPTPGTPPAPSVIPAGPKTSRSSIWVWLFGCGCLGLLGIFVAIFAVIGAIGGTVDIPYGDKVAIVYVTGPIVSGGDSGGIFGTSNASSDRIIADLRKAEEEHGVKAIVLRINSPGGSASASQEIYSEILRIRKGGMHVIVSMADLAASGGYYIASAGEKIYANNGTLTGSIGVIFQTTNLQGLYGKIGVKPETFKSGAHKDMFSPSRPVTDEERGMANSMIMDIYNQFVDDVLAGRAANGPTRKELLRIADGRVFTGRQARKLKLVDEIGTFQDAVRAAAKAGGITGDPNVWKVRRGFLEILAETKIDVKPQVDINVTGTSEPSASELLKLH